MRIEETTLQGLWTNCNRLHSWWSTQSRLATLLSSLIARRWVGLQTLWRFRLKDLSIDEMVGAWCFDCFCQAHRGLPVRFLLLLYTALFTVESLSLLYLLVISWIICVGRWCIDKLGAFHANQISKLRGGVRCGTWLYRFLIFAPLLTFMYFFYLKEIISTIAWSDLNQRNNFYNCLIASTWRLKQSSSFVLFHNI